MDLTVAGMLLGGVVLLVGGAEALVRGATQLAVAMKVTPLAIGLTVVAFGTSAPELAVSVQGAVSGAGDVAVGNVVGSNIFNLLAILGLAAATSALVVHRRVVRLDLPILVGATLLVTTLAWNGHLGRLEGAALAIALLGYTAWIYRASRRENHTEQTPQATPRAGWPGATGAIIIGLAALVAGAQLLIGAATSIAEAAGVTDLAIGLTVVAAGTSLPGLRIRRSDQSCAGSELSPAVFAARSRRASQVATMRGNSVSVSALARWIASNPLSACRSARSPASASS
jgi:cation:H+ antiporter